MSAPLTKTRAFIKYGQFTSRSAINFKGQDSRDKSSILQNRLLNCLQFPSRQLSSAVSRSFVAKQGSYTFKVIGMPMQVQPQLGIGLGLHQRTFLKNKGQLTSNFKGWFAHSKHQFSTSSLSDEDLRKEVDLLSEQFVETRELLEDARISFGSVYFNEDLRDAQESLSNTLEQYSKLLERLSDSQRKQVARTIGLKMEELKAQQNMIMETIRED